MERERAVLGVGSLFLALLFSLVVVSAIGSANYNIYNPTFSDGAGNLSSPGYALDMVMGEIAGSGGSSNYNVFLGFWNALSGLAGDGAGPIVTIVAPVNDSKFNESSVLFNVTLDEDGSWCGLSIDGAANVSMGGSGTVFNYTDGSVADGSHSFIVSCNDSTGNMGASASYDFFVDVVASSLEFVEPSPRDGGAVNGTSVTLNVTVSDASSGTTYAMFDDGLVGWWRMDDLNGTGAVVDISGEGNDGVPVNGAAQTDAGMFGEGFSFDGDGDYIDLGDAVVTSTPYTLCAWFKVPNSDVDQALVELFSTGGHWAGIKAESNDVVSVGIRDGGSSIYAVSTTTYSLNTWQHVCGVFTADNDRTIYLNAGSNASETTSATPDTFIKTYIGISQGTVWDFNGTIDEVLIFNRSLSATEIQALYNSSEYSLSRDLTGLSESSHSYMAYVVDEGGNVNSSSIGFEVDLTDPVVGFELPTKNDSDVTGDDWLFVNVSVSDSATNVSSFIDFDNSLVSWWRMDDVNATHVLDYVGGNDGSIEGDAVQVEAGALGKGMSFDGDDDFINISGSNLEVPNITLSFWVWFDVIEDDWIISKLNKSSSTDYDYGFMIRTDTPSDTIYWRTGTGASSSAVSGSISTGTWYHIVGTHDGSAVELFIDGVSQGTQSRSGDIDYTNVGELYLGGDGLKIFDFGSGMLDDVMIFNRSLSDDEIVALYANSTSKYYSNNFSGLGDGVHTFRAFGQDEAGNVNVTETRSVTVDTVPRIGLDVITPADFDGVNVSQTTFFNVTVNVSCSNADCGTINVSLDPISGCDPMENTTGECASCGGLFVGNPGEWDTDTQGACGSGETEQHIVLMDGHPIGDYCELVLPGGTNDCAVYAEIDGDLYACPSYERNLDTSVDSGDCDCFSMDVGDCSTSISSIFTLSSTYFTGGGDGAKSGLINTTEGATPFYTNASTNPLTTGSLNVGDSELVTFWVNATGTVDTTHVFFAFANRTGDLSHSNISSEWNVTITSPPNVAPDDPVVSINSSDGTNKTLQDLNCLATITDDDGDDMNVSVRWYKGGVLNTTVNFTGQANGTAFVGPLDSGNTTKGDNWSCGMRLYDGSEYSNWVNSSGNVTILNTAPVVTLSGPSDGSSTYDRTPEFNWTSVDDDGDSMTYDINISSVSCSSDNRYATGVGDLNYTPTSDLQCLYDHGDYYVWKVMANDGEVDGDWTVPWTINISALVSVKLLESVISFGSMTPGESNDTATSALNPFKLENNGTVFVNVSVNASALWSDAPIPSIYYRAKVDNVSGEEGAFSWLSSLTSWFNAPFTGYVVMIDNLNYSDATDSAEIDIFIEVPAGENPGVKSSNIVLKAELAE